MNPNFKTFQQFFNKCLKNTLPIMRNMRIENGLAVISDLETWVTFKADLPDGYYHLQMNKAFFISELSDDDCYPVVPSGEQVSVGFIQPDTIIKFSTCVGNDELRPVQDAISFTPEGVAATNAHMLRFDHQYYIHHDNFNALIKPTLALLSGCKAEPITRLIEATTFGEKPEDATAPVVAKYVTLVFDQFTIVQRLVEGVFPNYMSSVPDYLKINEETPLTCYSISLATLQDVAKTQKSFEAKGVWINKKGMKVSNSEKKLAQSWQAPTSCPMPERVPDGVIMPLMINDDPDTIAFNATFLTRFTTWFKGNIIVGSYDNTRAFGVWLEPANATAQTKAIPQSFKVSVPEPATEQVEVNPDLIITEIHELVKNYAVKWNNVSIRNIYLPRLAKKLNVVLSKVTEIYDQLSHISKDVTPEKVETEPEEIEEPEVETEYEDIEEVEEIPMPKQKPEQQHVPDNSGHGRNVLPPKASVTPIPEPVECQIIHYSERGIALVGNTKPIKDRLKELNGRWCPNLQINGEPVKAWVFSIKREQQIKQLLAS